MDSDDPDYWEKFDEWLAFRPEHRPPYVAFRQLTFDDIDEILAEEAGDALSATALA